MPLPPRAGRDRVRQDARDGAGRAPVPRDHPGRPRAGPAADDRRRAASRRSVRPCPTPRDVHRGATRVMSAADGRCSASRCCVVDDRARRRRRWRSASCSGCSSSPPAAGRLYLRRDGARRLRALRGRAASAHAGALRDRLHARSRARSTSRSASSPSTRSGLTPVVFLLAGLFFALAGDDLRRGRVAAPGPRRLDRLRALRLQRAVELRRRLGDPARLRDPPRGHVVLGDELPGGVLERRWARAPTSSLAVLRDHRLRRDPQRARLLDDARRTAIAALVVADLGAPARCIIVARAGRRSSTSTRSPTRSTSATTPTWERRDLRARRRDRRASPAWSRRPGCRGEVAVGPARAASGWSARAAIDRDRRLRRASRSSRSPRCRWSAARRRWRATTSRRRCSASPSAFDTDWLARRAEVRRSPPPRPRR